MTASASPTFQSSALASAGPTLSDRPSPSRVADGTPARLEPSPSPPSPPPPTLPAALVFAPGVIRTIPYHGLDIAALVGTVAYRVPIATAGPDRLFATDVRTGADRRIRLDLGAGERIAGVVTDGASLAVLAWHRINPIASGSVPCRGDESHPLTWRLLVAPLDNGLVAGPFSVLDSGVSRLVFTPAKVGEYCSGPLIPAVAVASGRIAYAVEDVTATRPAGSRVLVRSLPSGALERAIATRLQVFALAISSTTLAWVESANAGPSASRDVAWRVMRTPSS